MDQGTFKVGVGSADVTGPVMPVGMMGFGQSHQRVAEVAMPLRARAYAVELPSCGARFVFVNAELWGITQSVHRAVIERLQRDHPDLGLDAHTLMLTATHTHSGPGGYSHHVLFNLSIAGYVKPIFDAIVEGVCQAILTAVRALQPGRLSLKYGEIPVDEQVGINRAMAAYNSNEDVSPLQPDQAHLAIDREMTTLRFDDAEGRPLGAINWFGVHACNLHADNQKVHPDNKGFASRALEAHAASAWESASFEAAFPQTSAGDVTPNYRWDSSRGLAVGACEDDLESAKHNGDIQYRQARALMERCDPADLLTPQVRTSFRYVDYRAAHAAPEFGPGCEGATTGTATLGISMARGTRDGPGPLFKLGGLTWLLNRMLGLYHRLRAVFVGQQRALTASPHGTKFPMIEPGRGANSRILGLFRQALAPVPSAVDPTIARLRTLVRKGALGTRSWTPDVLPLQIVQVGGLAIIAVPFEPTTVAARRMKALVRRIMAPAGVTHAVVSGYANTYCGYLTTHEEYRLQGYEGASTYMGQWTLAATLTQLQEMAHACISDEVVDKSDTLRPTPFTDEELSQRAFAAVG
ncbi:MAG: neutral/alkaline non-lysosomal ceramidase N-terminal domain-containing protein [Myxococcota bacterium]